MIMRMIVLAGMISLGFATAAHADNEWEDRPVTAAERTRIVQAVRAAGCETPSRIERDDDGYEVEDVRCRDGVFDLDLDRRFRIIDRDREDNRSRT